MRRASTFVKPERPRGLGTVIMRAVAAADRTRDLTKAQAELVRRALKPFELKCRGKTSGLARLMGVDQSGFSRFMKGQQGTSWAVAVRAAALLGTGIDRLLEITPENLAFPGIQDPLALAAARLALLDGVPRAQIESRYRDAPMVGLGGMNLDDWYQKLSGGIEHEKLAHASPKLKAPATGKKPAR